MSRETESRRRSPSPVAKLMGLDGMPVPHRQSYCKHQKKTQGNYLQRTISPEKSQRRVTSDDNQLYARSSRHQQKIKDVFDVQETSIMKGSSSVSVSKIANLKPARAEMEFIQKKFMDAKRLVTVEKLQDSKEFHDVFEVLDSNKKLLLKYLQQPDSLFMKHLLDINDVLPHSNCTHVVAMKSSDDENHGCHDYGRQSVRRNRRKKHTKPHKHCSGHMTPSDGNYITKNSVLSTRIKLEDDERLAIFPKRIVVLKPKLGKAQNSSSIAIPSSHAFQSDCRKASESERTENRGMEMLRTHDHDVGVSSHEVRYSKEIYKKKTRQVRDNFDSSSMSSSLGMTKHDRNGSPFIGNNLDAEKCNSSDMFGLNGQCRSSSFRYKKSFLSAEAKKRLSERWKTTCDYHNMGVVSRSCTLAEMLAMPEKETMSAYMEPRHGGGSVGKILNDQRIEPFGISSRDGWKDICVEKLYRSRSLPTSSTAFQIFKANSNSLSMDQLVIPNKAFKWERKEAIRESLCQRQRIARRSSRSRRKGSHSSTCSFGESNNPVLEICTSQNQDSDCNDNDSAERDLLVVEESTFFPVKDQTQVLENWMDLRVKSDEVIVLSNDEKPEFSVHPVIEDNSCSGDQDSFISKELTPEASEDISFHLKSVPGLESPVSSKEADQPSPVSVLEPPFTDDLPPGSDCFESLSADLHGLRMQLKLLKLETEAFTESEETQHISSDEDGAEESVEFPDARKAEDSWEFSYLVDVLHNSAFKDAVPDMFVTTWHSLECPVDPSTFEELEKKYVNCSSQPRSERKLLFDRINLGILDIYQKFTKFTDPYPWIRPPTIQVGNNEGLCNNLFKFLDKQVKNVDEDIVEKVLGRTSPWLVLGYDVDVVGKEIERLLVDELIDEVVDMCL